MSVESEASAFCYFGKINKQNVQDNQNTKKSYMEILWI